jgi:hypothetical protein
MTGVLGNIRLGQPEDIEAINQKLDVYGEAMKSLHDAGLVTPTLPTSGYRGEMPHDTSSLDDEKLGDLLNNLSSWCDYVDSEHAKAVSQHRQAEEMLTSARASVRVKLKADEEGKKLAQKDKDDRVELDRDVVAARQMELYCFVRLTCLRSMREGSQKKWETVSRQITLRGQEVERMRRTESVAGVPMRATRSFTRRGHP